MIAVLGPIQTVSQAALPEVNAGGRAYMPVKPRDYIFSQFQYVAGIPAKNNTEGISLDKLRILNSLIDGLVNMKQKPVLPKAELSNALSGEQIDALITQYQEQIKTASATAETLLYKPVMPQTGTVVNLVA